MGHAYGLQRHSEFAQLFGLVWQNGNFAPGIASLIPTITVIGNISATSTTLPDNPDFFQIIDYAMKPGEWWRLSRSQSLRNTFNIGAALIDQYDTDDLYDRPATAKHGDVATLLRSSTMTATPQTTPTG